MTPDGTRAYASNNSASSVSVIDTTSNTVLATVAVGSGPFESAATPDGASVYVPNGYDGTMSVVDTVTASFPLGSFPYAAAFAPAATAVPAADVNAGAPPTYTATIGNNGSDTATGTTATITLSGTARTITSASTSQGSCAVTAPTVTCALGAVADVASATVTVNVTPTEPGTLTASTTATATETDPLPGNNTAAQSTTVATPPTADMDVDLTAQPHLGILVLPYLTYTLTARNTGPDAVTSAAVKATLPPGASATNHSTGCTTTGTTVTCTYGAVTNGASVNKTFRVPLGLLTLSPVTVTGQRTASAPTDTNTANDTAAVTCNALSVVRVTCP
ncbi:hypothetical protein ACFYNN_36140 [Streptomyces sp. NPDC006978]|uniref:hypothetical protein n=1 Tax=Streptomyces sp. NPDC006978 TaxID=3364769 RepID=UPI0036C0FE77